MNEIAKKPDVKICPYADTFFLVKNFGTVGAVNVNVLVKRKSGNFVRVWLESLLIPVTNDDGAWMRIDEPTNLTSRTVTCVAVWENPLNGKLWFDVCSLYSQRRYGLGKTDSPKGTHEWLMSQWQYVKLVKFVEAANSWESQKQASAEEVAKFVESL